MGTLGDAGQSGQGIKVGLAGGQHTVPADGLAQDDAIPGRCSGGLCSIGIGGTLVASMGAPRHSEAWVKFSWHPEHWYLPSCLSTPWPSRENSRW